MTESNVKKLFPNVSLFTSRDKFQSRKHDWTSRRFSRLHYCENNRSSQFARLYVYIGEIWTRQSTGGTGFSELQWLIKTARRISLRQPRCYWSEAINRLIRGLLNSSDFRRGSRLTVRRELIVEGKLLLMEKDKKRDFHLAWSDTPTCRLYPELLEVKSNDLPQTYIQDLSLVYGRLSSRGSLAKWIRGVLEVINTVKLQSLVILYHTVPEKKYCLIPKKYGKKFFLIFFFPSSCFARVDKIIKAK